MRLTPHFTLAELTRSQTAARRGIDNDPPATLYPALRATAEMLERIRAFLSQAAGHDVPLHISSGYRSPALERLVSGREFGDHLLGCAADWEAPAFGPPIEIARVLAPEVDRLAIGQLINEFPPHGWIHTSTRVPARAVNRVITIARTGVWPGVLDEPPVHTA
jgi:hypothetical protein